MDDDTNIKLWRRATAGVKCPTCKAEPGMPCLMKQNKLTSSPLYDFHTSRQDKGARAS